MKLSTFRVLSRDQRGLSTVEYTILLVLIVSATAKVWGDIGKDLFKKLDKAEGKFKEIGG